MIEINLKFKHSTRTTNKREHFNSLPSSFRLCHVHYSRHAIARYQDSEHWKSRESDNYVRRPRMLQKYIAQAWECITNARVERHFGVPKTERGNFNSSHHEATLSTSENSDFYFFLRAGSRVDLMTRCEADSAIFSRESHGKSLEKWNKRFYGSLSFSLDDAMELSNKLTFLLRPLAMKMIRRFAIRFSDWQFMLNF